MREGESTPAPAPPEPWLLYDGECPLCAAYVRMTRLRSGIGEVRLVDARRGGSELEVLRRAGLSSDEGMALALGGQLYHGDACVHRLGLLTTGSDAFNRLCGWVFRSERRSRALYPLLRTGRNLVVKLRGRQGIETEGDR